MYKTHLVFHHSISDRMFFFAQYSNACHFRHRQDVDGPTINGKGTDENPLYIGLHDVKQLEKGPRRGEKPLEPLYYQKQFFGTVFLVPITTAHDIR